MPIDPRQAAVERALKDAATALMARDRTVAEVFAALSDAVDGIVPIDVTPREAVAALRRSRKEQMLEALARYERQGRKRDAVSLVARDFAADKDDDVEVASLKRNLHRWRNEKNRQCRFAGENVG
jgi:hypothetical protein